jgi:colicin import membrane protein
MKTASAISAALHAGVLLWAVVSFTGKPLDAKTMESMPVDVVSSEQLSQMMKGKKDAPKKDEPAPLVEKKEEPKKVEEPAPKVTEKKEVQAAPEAAPPPPAPAPSPDAIAEKIKKEEPKQEAKVEPKPVPPKKPPEKKTPKFEADKIAALLDKRDPLRNAATGETPNNAPSLGGMSGNDKRLSQSEIDALRARLASCWSPPVGAVDAQKLFVVMRVTLKSDGTIAREPAVVGGTASPFGPALADSAKRALLKCQPYTMLKAETYEMWKDMEIKFDPREMFGG